MKLASFLLAALIGTIPLAASAQWQWIDKDGRKVFSDQAPPNDIPDKNIVRKPNIRANTPAPVAAAAAAGAQPGSQATQAASAPRMLSGTDKELVERAQQNKAAEAAKAKEENDKMAKQRASNCAQAREFKATMDSGIRIARTNAKGEREILDDAGRAAENKRIQDTIASECKPAS